MQWDVIDSGVCSAQENMQIDADLLETLSSHSSPIIRFYEWAAPSVTFGYFVDPARYLVLDAARSLGIDLARRPTGGGIVFHLWDMAFSVLVPSNIPLFSINTLDNYALVNQAVLEAVKTFLNTRLPLELTVSDSAAYDESCQRFCMARPTKYDVVWQGKKIAGAAQRKTKEGFLHQGTIALVQPDSAVLQKVLLPGLRAAEAMQEHTFALLGKGGSFEEAKKELRALLYEKLRNMNVAR